MRPQRDNRPYPNHADDPEQLPETAPKAGQTTNPKTFSEYSHDLYLTYKRTHLNGEGLWSNFIPAFRDHTIRRLTHANLTERVDLLTIPGVLVDTDQSS